MDIIKSALVRVTWCDTKIIQFVQLVYHMIHRVSIDSYSVSRYLSGLVKTISSSYYYTCKSRKRQPEPSVPWWLVATLSDAKMRREKKVNDELPWKRNKYLDCSIIIFLHEWSSLVTTSGSKWSSMLRYRQI